MYGNDTKSCYDMIIYLIASLSIQRIEIPKTPLISIFKLIQEAEYYIRTVFVNSDITINGSSKDKLF